MNATTNDHIKNECYNEQFLSVKSGCYDEREEILSAEVASSFYAFVMESSIIIFNRERMYFLFMCVRFFMLFIREVCS